jgi:putative Mn2+ efflux pump MntP
MCHFSATFAHALMSGNIDIDMPGMAHLCNLPFSRFPEDAAHWYAF